jgi:hypothetical protein
VQNIRQPVRTMQNIRQPVRTVQNIRQPVTRSTLHPLTP